MNVQRVVAAWSHLIEHDGTEATAAAFPDLASPAGGVSGDLLELWVAELDARAGVAAAHLQEVKSAESAARVEPAVSDLLSTCERLRDQHALTASELELAAVVVAVLASLEEEQ